MVLKDLVTELSDLVYKKKELAEQTKETNGKIEGLEQLIAVELLNSGTSKQSFNGIGTISVSLRDYPSIKDIETFYGYLKDNNEDGIIKRTVHAKTLAAWFKEKDFKDESEYKQIGLTNFQKTKINLRRT